MEEVEEVEKELGHITARLGVCRLSEGSCEALAPVLSSQSESLRELDLGNNNLQDSGVKMLSTGLKSPNCTLETLRLSGCMITGEGCASLASALRSNPSHLRELDLSYNNPGDTGSKMLAAGLEDPNCRLDTLRLDPAGDQWLRTGLKKYSCELRLDTNTVSKNIKLSEDNKKATKVEKNQPYPDHPDRFDKSPQVLCSACLTGRCYWEVRWKGLCDISMSYRGIGRKGGDECFFGRDDQSWSLHCSDGGSYCVWHSKVRTPITNPSSPHSISNRVAVYLDHPAGTLSFYSVFSDSLIHMHTFNTTFTEPLYPGLGFGFGSPDSSMSLCPL